MWTFMIFAILFAVCQGAPQFPQGGSQGFGGGQQFQQPQQYQQPQPQPQQYAPQYAGQQYAPQQQQYGGGEQYGGAPQPQGTQQRQQPSNIIPANVYNGFGKDGSLNFAFQTLDGQQRTESLGSDGSVKGSYSYLGADGKQVEIKYTADKNGFHASGPTVPTPSPAFALASAQAAQRREGPDGGAPEHYGGGGGPAFGGGGYGGGGYGGGFGGPASAGSQGAPAFAGGQGGHSFQGFQGGQSAYPAQGGGGGQAQFDQQYAPFQG